MKVWELCGYYGRKLEYCWEMLENMGFDRKYGDCLEEGKYVKIWEIVKKIMKNYRKLEIWEMEHMENYEDIWENIKSMGIF